MVVGVASRRWVAGAAANAAAAAPATSTSRLRMWIYLNRSSNAFLALDSLEGDTDDLVSRSTVVRGSKWVHSLRASFGDTRTGTGRWHSNGLPVSKWTHCTQLCRSAPPFGHCPVALHAVAAVSSVPH